MATDGRENAATARRERGQRDVLQRITNKRQAARIMSVDEPEALVLQMPGERTWWATRTERGLYLVGTARNALYMCRYVDVAVLDRARKTALDEDVTTDPHPAIRRERARAGGDDQ